MRNFPLSVSAVVLTAVLSPVAGQATVAAPGRNVAPPADLAAVPEDRRTGFEAIDAELCREWLSYLASDELRGRGTGHPGYKKAAEFVAAHFEKCGLQPVGDDGTYFQNVPFSSVGPSAASYVAVVDAAGKELLRLVPGDGLGGSITSKSEGEFELVVLTADSADAVEAADLEGKAVLFVDNSPELRRGTEASRALRRASAAVVLEVDDAAAANVERRVMPGGASNRINRARMTGPGTFAVSAAKADEIRGLLAAHPKLKLATHVDIEQSDAFAANVVGYLEGSDPALKAEIVGIGSHLDHIGARGEVINNGADDDGSGTTGVLAVARAFAENGVKPRRSILFMCFSGEEMGLVGSRYYTENPIFPNEAMVAELQMDMIGRNEERVNRRTGEAIEKAEDNLNTLHLVGTEKLSKALHEICLETNEKYLGFEFEYDEESVFGRSDHANFARKDIPIAFFFTGFHPQYHQPDDTVDRIDFPKLARVARLVYLIAFDLANADEPPLRDRKWSEIPRQGR